MNASNLPSFNPATSWESTPLEAIQLSTEQVDQALDSARATHDPNQLWQRYINALAQLGFEQWLQARAPEFAIPQMPTQGEANQDLSHCPLININGFAVCLLPQSHHPDEFIEMPPTLIEGTVPKAHFYVIAAIAEEQSTVEIFAVLRQDQLIQKRSLLSIDEDNFYPVPLSWFDGDADSLLLYLRCSEPAAFAQTAQAQAAQAQTQSSEQRTAALPTLAKPKQLIQAAVNTALWLDGILDEMSQQLSWMLMPAPSLASQGLAMRGENTEEMQTADEGYQLLQALRNQGVEIPDALRPATKIFEIGSEAVRLYALSWPTSESEWELILILGPAPNRLFPGDVRLVVEDQTQQLVEEPLRPGGAEDCIFVSLSAEVNEIFLAKIKLGNQVVEVLPTFSFQPRQA